MDSAAVMRWVSTNFKFDKPDSSFIKLDEGNGYYNAEMIATIKWLSFPQKYSVVKNQFMNQKSTDSSLFIKTLSNNSNGIEAFTLIRDEISPDKTRYENYLSLTTILNFGSITVCVVGAYPKSKDSLLREKYLSASLSIKEQ